MLAALLEVLPTKVESSTVRFKDPSGDNGGESSRYENPEGGDRLEVQKPQG